MHAFPSFKGSRAILLTFGLLLSAACNPNEAKKPKSMTLDGEVTRIDAEKGRIAMRVRNPKNKSEFLSKEVEGATTPTTEIKINGRTAKISELRVKDVVEATGYRQGKGDNEQIIAESIHVDRPNEMPNPPVDNTSNSKPVPQPTENANTSATTTIPMPTFDANTAAAAPSQPPKTGSLTREELIRLFASELDKERTKAIMERAQLLKEGRPPDDIDVLRLDGRIAKADQAIAQAEDEAAKFGIVLRTAPGSSQPAATQSAGNP